MCPELFTCVKSFAFNLNSSCIDCRTVFSFKHELRSEQRLHNHAKFSPLQCPLQSISGRRMKVVKNLSLAYQYHSVRS